MLIYDDIFVDVVGGMIITGGANGVARNAAEVFEIGSGQKCILPQLPDKRYRHSQVIFDNIVSI